MTLSKGSVQLANNLTEDVQWAVERMKAWARQHPQADTQGLDDEEWTGLAAAAFNLDWTVLDDAREEAD